MRDRVTIAQIAEAAGVSISTVSKVLNGNTDVSAATRQRVQGLLVDRRYERRASARSGAPPLIDLVFAELESPWAMEIVRGAVAAASEAGLSVALTSLSDGIENQSWLDHISVRGTRGIILLLARLGHRDQAELRARGLPFAVVDPRWRTRPERDDRRRHELVRWVHCYSSPHRTRSPPGGRDLGAPDLLCSRARHGWLPVRHGSGRPPVGPRAHAMG